MTDTADLRPSDGSASRFGCWTVGAGQLALLLILSLFSRFSVMDLEDASTLFNYHNNVAGSAGLFIYNEYVPLSMELVAWAASPFTPGLQVLVYVAAAIGLGLTLSYELIRLLTAMGARRPVLLASGILVLLHFVEVNLYGNLTYGLWSGLAIATIMLARSLVLAHRLMWWEWGVLPILLISQPVAVGFVPGLLLCLPFVAWRQRGIILAVIALTLSIALSVRLESLPVAEQVQAILTTFGQFFNDVDTDSRLDFALKILRHSIFILGLALGAAALLAILRRIRDRGLPPIETAAGLMIMMGTGTVLVYLISPRLPQYYGIDGRYLVVFTVSTAVAAVYLAGIWGRWAERSLQVGSLMLILLGLGVGVWRAPTNLERAGQLTSFIAAASSYRETCSNGAALALAREKWALVYLCRPLTQIEPGWHEIEDIADITVIRYLFDPEKTSVSPAISVSEPFTLY